MKHLPKVAIFAFALMWYAVSSRAQAVYPVTSVQPVVVYNTFGPGNTFIPSVGWGVGNFPSVGFKGQAEWFVPGITGDLNSVELAMFRGSGTGAVNFFVTQDSGGIPGTVLESYSSVVSSATTGSLISLISVTQPLLEAGTKYWICAEPGPGALTDGWNENNQGYITGYAEDHSPWGWQAFDGSAGVPDGVFRVNVIPVPEPSTAGLIILGAGFFGLRFVKRQG